LVGPMNRLAESSKTAIKKTSNLGKRVAYGQKILRGSSNNRKLRKRGGSLGGGKFYRNKCRVSTKKRRKKERGGGRGQDVASFKKKGARSEREVAPGLERRENSSSSRKKGGVLRLEGKKFARTGEKKKRGTRKGKLFLRGVWRNEGESIRIMVSRSLPGFKTQRSSLWSGGARWGSKQNPWVGTPDTNIASHYTPTLKPKQKMGTHSVKQKMSKK